MPHCEYFRGGGVEWVVCGLGLNVVLFRSIIVSPGRPVLWCDEGMLVGRPTAPAGGASSRRTTAVKTGIIICVYTCGDPWHCS